VSVRPIVLFVSHHKEKCGVHQFGITISEALTGSRRFDFRYVECQDPAEFAVAVKQHAPVAVIFNHHRGTMPWLRLRDVRGLGVPRLGIIHEVTQHVADTASDPLFDFFIAPDPTLLLTNTLVYKTGRLVAAFRDSHPAPTVPTIGSFGFGLKGKGFERLIDIVQQEFDQAVVRLHIPYADFGDSDGAGARAIAAACQRRVTRDGIRLEFTHQFLSRDELLEFLSGNSLNAFLYEELGGRGIASVTDFALAVDRPIAITRTQMFRHLWSVRPSICVEDATLRQLLETGSAPLRRLAAEWSVDNLVWDYERIVSSALSRGRPSFWDRTAAATRRLASAAGAGPATQRKAVAVVRRLGLALGGAVRSDWTPVVHEFNPTSVPGRLSPYDCDRVPERHFNRILDDEARRRYAPALAYLAEAVPDMLARKFAAANIQQAFVFDTVAHFARARTKPAILSVGSFDDTAAAALNVSGLETEEIDPVLNYDLDTYLTKPSCRRLGYDIILSTSVIEHVADDEQFIKNIGALLAPGGIGVLTCDFNDSYRAGDPIPKEDFRFYTASDLYDRLMKLLPDCSLVDTPAPSDRPPDFEYGGCRYSFASLVFRKRGDAVSAATAFETTSIPVEG